MSAKLLGQRVTWTVLKRDPRSRKLVHDYTRAGEVWSLGPTSETLWVLPDLPRDGEGAAVCVAVKPGGVLVQRPNDVERSKAATQAAELAELRAHADWCRIWHANNQARIDRAAARGRLGADRRLRVVS